MKEKLFLINGTTVTGSIVKQYNGKVLFRIGQFTKTHLKPNDKGFRDKMRHTIGRTCNPCFIPIYNIIEKDLFS